MKTSILISILISVMTLQNNFLNDQKKYERVKASIKEKEKIIREELRKNNLTTDNLNILITVFKDEKLVHIYAKKISETTYKEILSYPICEVSGELGPKRKNGDNQVPEGFYYINMFNPNSNFYLSLGINYPNLADKRKSKSKDPGSNIFIHGSCVTIGCIPMTDDKIKEIYLYAVFARNNGQLKIPVYIFPFEMTHSNFEKYTSQHTDNKELIDFWTNLKKGFDKFEKEKKELNISVDSKGNYIY